MVRVLQAARKRARAAGVPFALLLSDIPPVPEVCPALGIRLRHTTGCAQDCSPSLDRLTPELGYVPGNVAWISKRANTIKQNATPAELAAVAVWASHAVPKEPYAT